MIFYSEDKKRELIMDYYLNPRNRVNQFKDLSYLKQYKHSLTCVDEVEIFFNKEKTDFKMIAKGCAIFLSSCEIFVERILELGFKQKDHLIALYEKLINKLSLSEEEKQFLGKLIIYENVSTHLNRKECAQLIANVFKTII